MDEALDDIAHLDVVELLHLYAALETAGHLAHVILEAAKGAKLTLVDFERELKNEIRRYDLALSCTSQSI